MEQKHIKKMRKLKKENEDLKFRVSVIELFLLFIFAVAAIRQLIYLILFITL